MPFGYAGATPTTNANIAFRKAVQEGEADAAGTGNDRLRNDANLPKTEQ
ncbi:hypothetical protein [Methylomonas koyamae]|nr:hypothetical protein [Methylomonas koyamae]WNB74392.1 hypothetical protein RI210_14005 [Methylomonas koyamae]